MFIPFHDENPVRRTPMVMYLLLAANVLAFLWVLQLSTVRKQVLFYERGFVPARIAQLGNRQPIVVPVKEEFIHPWFGLVARQRGLQLPPSPGQIGLSLLTCMFLHAGWVHLLGNLWFLYLFGNSVEDRLGPVRFLILYLLGGVVASLAHWLVEPRSLAPVVGASGAVATVIGAYTVTWPWARVHTLVFLFVFVTVIEVPALVVNGVWFIGQVLAGREAHAGGAGVAWWAHVGGFLAGVFLMPVFDSLRSFKGEPADPTENFDLSDE